MQKLHKYCKTHGALDEKDILAHKSKINKSGLNLRCRMCYNTKTFRNGLKCKTHGILGPDDIKKNGRCKKCHRLSASRKVKENRAWFNAKMAADKIKNPEKWKRRWKREYEQKLKRNTREEINTKEIIRVHKLTHEIYEKMFKEQDHKCKICNKPETRAGRVPGTIARMTVDHCHETNRVRGLLCARCNAMIGFANDDIDILESAIIYLQEFKESD